MVCVCYSACWFILAQNMTHNTERLSDEKLIRALVDLDQERFNIHLDTWFERGGSLYYLADGVYNPPRHLVDALNEAQVADYHTLLLRNFCILMEQWLPLQTPKIKTAVILCGDTFDYGEYGFYLDFLRNCTDPVAMINSVDASKYFYLTDRKCDRIFEDHPFCDGFTSMLEHNLGACVDAAITQPEVQKNFSKSVVGRIDFFDRLLRTNNTTHALHYLNIMQNHFSPGWVGLMLKSMFNHANTDVSLWLSLNDNFTKFLQHSHFGSVHVRELDIKQTPQSASVFEDFFPHIWEALIKTFAQTDPLSWRHSLQQPKFDGQRLEWARRAIERSFERIRADYVNSPSYNIDPEVQQYAFTVLDCLTADDALQWTNTPWHLDQLYATHQHPVLCNARIGRTLKNTGHVSIKKI